MKGNIMQLNVCIKSVYDVYLFCSTRTLRDQASGTLSRFSLIKVAGSVVREVVSCHLPHLPLLPDRQINVASLTWETRAISTVLYKHCSCVTGELPEKVFCSILACPIRFCWIKCFNQATRVKGEVIYISNSCQVSWFIFCFVFVFIWHLFHYQWHRSDLFVSASVKIFLVPMSALQKLSRQRFNEHLLFLQDQRYVASSLCIVRNASKSWISSAKEIWKNPERCTCNIEIVFLCSEG